MEKKLAYRPEVDGLRAIAVLYGILFHLDRELLPGGYIGVDMFFVISGYLITKIILEKIDRESFQVSQFYVRRVKRLYPTYATVMLASFILAWLILPPQAMTSFASSAQYSLVYISNFYFFIMAGYFDLGSEMKPLLHTWTLSVEEQFYLLYPLLLIFIATKRIRVWLVCILLASFLINVLLVNKYPTAVFYLLPFRIWELLAGAVLAVGIYPWNMPKWAHGLALTAAMTALLTAVFIINQNTPFPGYAALAPILATYVLIGSSEKYPAHFVTRLLQLRPVVIIGILSYALYLWHWPIIVFYKNYFHQSSLSHFEVAALLLFTFIPACISTYLIEPKIRKGNISTKKLIIAVAVFTLTLFAIAVYLQKSDGAVYRFKEAGIFENNKKLESTIKQNLQRNSCKSHLANKNLGVHCIKYGNGEKIDYIVWGDSLAHNPGIALAQSQGKTSLVFSSPGCPAIINVRRYSKASEPNFCQKGENDQVLEEIQRLKPEKVLLFGLWSNYEKGWTRYNTLHFLCDGPCAENLEPKQHLERSFAAMKKHLDITVAEVQKVSHAVIMKSTPVFLRRGEDIIFMSPQARKRFSHNKVEHIEFHKNVNNMIDTIATRHDATVFDPVEHFCDEEICRITDNEYLFYHDHNHLTVSGWLSIGEDFRRLVE